MTAQVTQIEQESVQPVPIQYYGFEPKVYKNYRIGLEPIKYCVEEIDKTHTEHWQETEVNYLTRPMDVDYDSFISHEGNRSFLLFTIRTKDNELVGQLGYFLSMSIHHKNMLQAKEDFFFITKAHRSGGLASQLLTYAEESLIALGVKLIGMTDKSPCGGKSLEPFLTREGYQKVAIAYVKEV